MALVATKAASVFGSADKVKPVTRNSTPSHTDLESKGVKGTKTQIAAIEQKSIHTRNIDLETQRGRGCHDKDRSDRAEKHTHSKPKRWRTVKQGLEDAKTQIAVLEQETQAQRAELSVVPELKARQRLLEGKFLKSLIP